MSFTVPFEPVFPDLPMHDTVAPDTGSPASVTVNVTVVAVVWLNELGFAVSVNPARICVCQNSMGFGDFVSRTLAMTSSLPNVPSAWMSSKMKVPGGAGIARSTPNAVAALLVLTAWIMFCPESNHTTVSRPCSPAARATRVTSPVFECGTTLGVVVPTFHRSMWAQPFVLEGEQ